ncbi:MAG TPA: sigma-70 family RNA polymerase sigma factor [Candidatus Nanoarchaeia archaeon]|nr:sigma-70 family RNA polymerase sigma factor [Candidatus Nanoarchaeia archaeon]
MATDELSCMVQEWQKTKNQSLLGKITTSLACEVNEAACYFSRDRPYLRRQVEEEINSRVYGILQNYRGESKLLSELWQVANNVVCDLLRRKKVRDAWFEHAKHGLTGTSPDCTDQNLRYIELGGLVAEASTRLPEKQRAVLLFYIQAGGNPPSYKEISEKLGLSVDTVKCALFRARQQLRQELQPYLTAA